MKCCRAIPASGSKNAPCLKERVSEREWHPNLTKVCHHYQMNGFRNSVCRASHRSWAQRNETSGASSDGQRVRHSLLVDKEKRSLKKGTDAVNDVQDSQSLHQYFCIVLLRLPWALGRCCVVTLRGQS